MPSMQKPSVTYAPRGVVKKVIALRLLAPELAKHESLAKLHHCSSASLARTMYLRGLSSYDRTPGGSRPTQRMHSADGVNRA